MEKAMMIKIYMYHMSDSIISKHNVYLNFCLSLFSWHEDHKESIINVQYLYVTHMSIPSLLSFNRVEYWKKHHFQAFQPLSNIKFLLFPMTSPETM